MAGDWNAHRFADAPLEIIDGDRGTNYPKQADFNSDGHCLFLNAGNVTNNGFEFQKCAFISEERDAALRKGKLQRHDVVLTTRGTVGNAAYFDDGVPFDNIRINSGMVILRARASALSPRFLYLFVRSRDFANQVSSLLTGSAQPQLPIRDINIIRIQLPSLKQQQAIAHILGTFDDKVELNRRMNQTLEAMARAIFKSWFVDFDPVRAKAEHRDTGLPPAIADLFPDSFEASELGEIPTGWDVVSVDDLADLNARTLGRNDPLDIIDYIEISKVMRGDVLEIARYERGSEPSRARRRLTHGDTVLSTVRPNRGAYFLCLNPANTRIASTGFAVATPKDGSWAFLHTALTQPEVGEELGRLADGGAYPAIRPEVIRGLPLVAPHDRRIVEVFENLARPLFQKADRNRAQSLSLAAVRDALLPQLMSGEIIVGGG